MITDIKGNRVDNKEVNRVMARLHNVYGISYEDICYILMDYMDTDHTASALYDLMIDNEINIHDMGWIKA